MADAPVWNKLIRPLVGLDGILLLVMQLLSADMIFGMVSLVLSLVSLDGGGGLLSLVGSLLKLDGLGLDSILGLLGLFKGGLKLLG